MDETALREGVDGWQADIGQLRDAPRFRKIQASADSRAPVLRGERLVRWRQRKGGMVVRVADDTAQRAAYAGVLAYYRYPLDELIALLLTSEWWGDAQGADEAWRYDEARRLAETAWARYRTRGPAEPTRVLKRDVRPRRQGPAAPRAAARRSAQVTTNRAHRGGRPRVLSPEQLYAWLCAQGGEPGASGERVVQLCPLEIATRLSVSRSSVERSERVLRQRGWAARRVLRRGQPSQIVLTPSSGPASDLVAPEPSEHLGDQEGNEQGEHEEAVMPGDTVVMAPASQRGSGEAEDEDANPTEEAERGARAELLGALFDEASAAYPHRISKRVAKHYVRANSAEAWSEEELEAGYAEMMPRRRWRRATERRQARLRGMRLSALKCLARSVGSQTADLLRRGKRQAAFMWRFAGEIETEIARRLAGEQKAEP